MGLSRSNRCLIRGKQILLTPEEEVRQSLLSYMIGSLGFPKGLIAVEKRIQTRRFDLVCYTKKGSPLLLVECKALFPKDDAFHQALGYNFWLEAPFICIAAQKQTPHLGIYLKTYWKESEKIASIPYLPTFLELEGVCNGC